MKLFLFDPGMVPDYTYELATGLSKASDSIYVYSGSDFGDKVLNFKNFNYHRNFINVSSIKNDFSKKIIKTFLYVFFMFYLLKIVKKERPDILHLQWIRIPLIDNLLLNCFQKYTKVILTLHNTTLNHGDDESYIAKILSLGLESALKKTTRIILHTNYSKDKLLRKFPSFSDKVDVIPHGLLKFPSLSEKKILNFDFSDKTVLLFFGNFNKYKGLDVLIEAMQYLREEEVTLLIAGRPQIPLKPLLDLSQELEVSDKIIWYPHFIDEKHVSEFFQHAHAIILPHRNIDQSGVLATAVYYEKPIIASRIGGFLEVISDNEHGFLFENGNSEDLSLKISTFMHQNKFEVFSKEMRKLKHSWKSWDEISIDHLTVYTKSVGKN